MRISRTQNRIRELMAIFVTQMKGASIQSDTYVNQLAENILIPIFKLIYGWNSLRNLNATERRNYPAIDLADDEARVAIQVTITPDSTKVKETLRKFVDHGLYEKYDRLIIYILTEKQGSYLGRGFKELVGERFSFDKDQDIWDFRNILSDLNGLTLEIALRIEHIMEAHFGDGRVTSNLHELPRTEEVFLNLLELRLPDALFIAQIAVDREEVIKESKRWHIQLSRNSLTRNVIRAALEQHDLGFGTDWICYEGKVITFHDLSNPELPLHQMIDPGTVDTLSPASFYSIDDNYERVFKSLLWRTLQQTLFHRGVRWQNEEKMFIFVDLNNETIRKETWQGRNRGERAVYHQIMKTNKPDEVLRYEHLGFRTQFKRFGEQWYLLIKPEWFASYNGYNKDKFGNFVEWKKRNENNDHVSGHARFIAYFLKNDPHSLPPDMFEKEMPQYIPFLTFGEFISFNNAPALDDNVYLPSKKGASSKDQSEKADQPKQLSFLEP